MSYWSDITAAGLTERAYSEYLEEIKHGATLCKNCNQLIPARHKKECQICKDFKGGEQNE